MVQAILSGRKTQTRRIVKDIPEAAETVGFTCFTPEGCVSARGKFNQADGELQFAERFIKCPYGKPGDILWVRETGAFLGVGDVVNKETKLPFLYKADYTSRAELDALKKHSVTWKPSIHMPKAASRLWLQIKDVRVERLHGISDSDCLNEGIEVLPSWPEAPEKPVYRNYLSSEENKSGVFDPKFSYISLFNKITPDAGNPWVWVVEFEVLSSTGKPAFLNQEEVAS
jgi:hypothetical protein